jgi:hypothetical protein
MIQINIISPNNLVGVLKIQMSKDLNQLKSSQLLAKLMIKYQKYLKTWVDSYYNMTPQLSLKSNNMLVPKQIFAKLSSNTHLRCVRAMDAIITHSQTNLPSPELMITYVRTFVYFLATSGIMVVCNIGSRTMNTGRALSNVIQKILPTREQLTNNLESAGRLIGRVIYTTSETALPVIIDLMSRFLYLLITIAIMSGTAVFNTFVTSLISFGTSAGPAGGPPAGPGNSGFTIQGSPRFPGGPSPQAKASFEVISKCPKETPYYCGTNTEFGQKGRGKNAPCVKDALRCGLPWEAARLSTSDKTISTKCSENSIKWGPDSQECKSAKNKFRFKSPESAFRFY